LPGLSCRTRSPPRESVRRVFCFCPLSSSLVRSSGLDARGAGEPTRAASGAPVAAYRAAPERKAPAARARRRSRGIRRGLARALPRGWPATKDPSLRDSHGANVGTRFGEAVFHRCRRNVRHSKACRRHRGSGRPRAQFHGRWT